MINVEYYLTTDKRCFLDYAEALSEATDESVTVVNNKFRYPATLAEGRFEFYELEEGLSLILADNKFHKEIRFTRLPNKSNDYYYIVFNVQDCLLIVNKQSGRVMDLGKDMSEAIIFSSSKMGISFIGPTKSHFRGLLLIIHRTWAVKHLLRNAIPFQTTRLQQFAQYLPMQFTCNIDLQSKNIVEEMLNIKLAPAVQTLYLQGNALKLFAMFSKNIVEDTVTDKRIYSDDAMRIMQIKEKVENNIEEPIPSVEDFARSCLMGKTRFASLFRSIYGKSYSEIFKDVRLKKAAELLGKGESVSSVGHKIGYNNLGHFAKAFKEQYGTTPKIYQKEIHE